MIMQDYLKDVIQNLLHKNSSFKKNLYISSFETKVGTLFLIADHQALYLLDFLEGRYLKRHCIQLKNETQSNIVWGTTPVHDLIEKELKEYFEGTLKEFKTPLVMSGTIFQKAVWSELKKISYGITVSYSEIAHALQRPKAFRAVARANSTNKLAIIVPCHRVINAQGTLSGYSGGVKNKQWLIDHERNQRDEY